jgi:hypothetical protein
MTRPRLVKLNNARQAECEFSTRGASSPLESLKLLWRSVGNMEGVVCLGGRTRCLLRLPEPSLNVRLRFDSSPLRQSLEYVVVPTFRKPPAA